MRVEKLKDSNALKAGQLVATWNGWQWWRYDAFTGSRKGIEPIQLYRHRQGPVPGIRRRKNGSWLRHPRTTSERRANTVARTTTEMVEYHGVASKLRRKRSHRRLPSTYDDLFIRYQRSWKKHRRIERRHPNDINRGMHSPPFWVR